MSKKRKTRTEIEVQSKAVWRPRVRLPGECEPRKVNIMAGKYDGKLDQPFIRAGAQDFLNLPSGGFST